GGRNPIARAARTRGAVENRVRSVFPATWPVSSEDRAIAKSARAAARPRRCLCQLRPAKWARPVPGAHRYPEKGSASILHGCDVLAWWAGRPAFLILVSGVRRGVPARLSRRVGAGSTAGCGSLLSGWLGRGGRVRGGAGP